MHREVRRHARPISAALIVLAAATMMFLLSITASEHVAASDSPTFVGPTSLSIGPNGVLYVSDSQAGLKELSPDGELLRTLPVERAIADPSSGYLYQDAGAVARGHGYVGEIKRFSPQGVLVAHLLDKRFLNGEAMAVGGRGNLVLAVLAMTPQSNPGVRMYKVSPRGKIFSSWLASTAGYDFADAAAMAVDRVGNIYISARAGSCSRGCQGMDAVLIEKYSPSGGLIQIWRRPTSAAVGPGLGVDAHGDVISGGGTVVEEFSPQGHPIWRVGTGGCGPLAFRTIGGMAVAADGTIYVSDEANRNIQKVSRSGAELALWGGCPSTTPPTPILPTPPSTSSR